MCGDTYMTGSRITLAADGTAQGDHRHAGKPNSIGAEQNHLESVIGGLHATITPQLNTVADAGIHQRAVRLDNTDLSGQPDILQSVLAGCACSAIKTGK